MSLSSLSTFSPHRVLGDISKLTPQTQLVVGGVLVTGFLIVKATKSLLRKSQKKGPIVIATWRFGGAACGKTGAILSEGAKNKVQVSVVDAVEAGIHEVELNDTIRSHCGYGGLPNAKGAMEHEAALMDGRTLNVGSVIGLQSIACPIRVAKYLLYDKDVNVLSGKGALEYAMKHGFQKEMTLSERGADEFEKWRSSYSGDSANEQLSVLALLAGGAGAAPLNERNSSYGQQSTYFQENDESHDSLAVIAMGANGDIVVGTSSSGTAFKLEGRVGDAPLIGSGFYADNTAGAAAATGNGEEIMKFCLSHCVVEYMREGMNPSAACKKAISRVKTSRLDKGQIIPLISIIAMDRHGNIGAGSTISSSRPFTQPDATSNPNAFQYSVFENGKCRVYEVSDSS